MANRVAEKVREFWARIYFILHLLWINACVWCYNYMYALPRKSRVKSITDNDSSGAAAVAAVAAAQGGKPPATLKLMQKRKKPTRKLLHIGDDFALGVGDWVTFLAPSGLVQYLHLNNPAAIAATVPLSSAAVSYLLLSTWVANIEGKSGATSEDWIPGGVLFESCFNPLRDNHLDADIVMITLGTNDTCAPSQSATNIMRLYKELRARLNNDDAVIIINIPPVPQVVLDRPDDSAVKKRMLARNEALRAALIKEEFDERALRAEKNNVGEDVAPKKHVDELRGVAHGALRFGVDLHQMFEKQEDVYTLRGHFLKPRAYREAARLLAGPVLLAQKSVEAADMRQLMR